LIMTPDSFAEGKSVDIWAAWEFMRRL
jgi:hypothetical protein